MKYRLFSRWALVVGVALLGSTLHAQTEPSTGARSTAELAIPRPDLSNEPPLLVLSVVDGDTINVLVGDAIEKVRLVGVDAPETKDPRDEIGFYGAEASAFLGNLLKGERVYLMPEPGAGRDKYGRRLAHVYRAPDGLWVNLELVRQGYATVYSEQAFQSLDLFLTCQRLARMTEKGLWDSEARARWEISRQKQAEPPPATPVVVAPPPAVTPAPQPAAPSVQPPSEPPAKDADRVTVYVTRTGAKYHRAGCSYLSKSSIPIALKEAKARYGACSRCNPPR